MHWSLSQSLHGTFPNGAPCMRPEADPRSAWDMTAQHCASVAQQLNLRQTQNQTLCWYCAHHSAVVTQQLKLRQALFQGLCWCHAGSLPRLLERLVSAKEQQGEEYQLLLKLLLHASHLKVHHPCLCMCSLLSSVLPWLQGIAHHLSRLYSLQLDPSCLAMTAFNA